MSEREAEAGSECVEGAAGGDGMGVVSEDGGDFTFKVTVEGLSSELDCLLLISIENYKFK